MGRKWTQEQKDAQRDRLAAQRAAKAETSEEWSEERKDAARAALAQKNEAGKSAEIKSAMRVPVGGRRDITSVGTTPKGYVDRWVNDNPGRIEKFKNAGYVHVESASVGDSNVDGSHNEDGVVSRDMGKAVTAYLMRQREDYFHADQAEKQKVVDETEESLRRSESDNRDDGRYGEVKIGK